MKRNNVFQDSDGGSSSDDSSSTAKKKSKKLVIPLIKKNNYNMSIEEKELVEKIVKDSTEAFSEENTNLKNIPLIQQNKIPNIDGVENEKDKLKLDLSHRPEQSTLEEYEDVSVEEFGLALMRGMGWKDGMSVGKNQKSGLVAPIIMKPRPLGLGLGATPAPFAMNGEKNFKGSELKNKNTEVEEKIEENKPRKKAAALTKYEEDQIELAKFKSGLKVFVKQGKFKNIIGKIVESKLIKNDGISVKLKIKKDLNGITDKEGEIIKVWSDQCQLEDENGDFKGKDATSSLKKVKTWVKPYIKVMITNKQFGKYYKCKGIVQDISSNGQFSLKIENGQLVEKLTDFDVESYIPSVGKPVLVLKCKLDKHIIGQTGKILEKNVVKEKCVVQLDRDFEIKTFDFDDISEIVEEEHFDFS